MQKDQPQVSGDAVAVWPGLSSFTRRLNFVSMASLFAIVCFTVVAVFTRYVLNRPIPGDNEITELMTVMATFFGAVAVAQLDKSHVNIDIALEMISPRARLLTDAITTLFGIFIVGLIVWRTGVTAWLFAEHGNTTRMMSIPLYPFALVIPLGCFLLFLVLVTDLWACFRQGARLGSRRPWGCSSPPSPCSCCCWPCSG